MPNEIQQNLNFEEVEEQKQFRKVGLKKTPENMWEDILQESIEKAIRQLQEEGQELTTDTIIKRAVSNSPYPNTKKGLEIMLRNEIENLSEQLSQKLPPSEPIKPREIEEIFPEITRPVPAIETAGRGFFGMARLAGTLLGRMLGFEPSPKPVPSDYTDMQGKALEQKVTMTGAKEQPIKEQTQNIGSRIRETIERWSQTFRQGIRRIFG